MLQNWRVSPVEGKHPWWHHKGWSWFIFIFFPKKKFTVKSGEGRIASYCFFAWNNVLEDVAGWNDRSSLLSAPAACIFNAFLKSGLNSHPVLKWVEVNIKRLIIIHVVVFQKKKNTINKRKFISWSFQQHLVDPPVSGNKTSCLYQNTAAAGTAK